MKPLQPSGGLGQTPPEKVLQSKKDVSMHQRSTFIRADTAFCCAFHCHGRKSLMAGTFQHGSTHLQGPPAERTRTHASGVWIWCMIVCIAQPLRHEIHEYIPPDLESHTQKGRSWNTWCILVPLSFQLLHRFERPGLFMTGCVCVSTPGQRVLNQLRQGDCLPHRSDSPTKRLLWRY